MADEPKGAEASEDEAREAQAEGEPDYKALYEQERAHARTWEKRAKANKSSAEERAKTAEERIAELTRRLDEKERAEARARVAAGVAERKGIPVDLVVGEDEEAMEAFADRMLKHFKPKPAPKAEKPGGFAVDGPDDSGLREFTRQLLGNS